MNKIMIAVVALFVILIAGGAAYALMQTKSSTLPGTSTTSGSNGSAAVPYYVHACDVLTGDIASSILGQNPDHPTSGITDSVTSDIEESTCTYTKTNDTDSSKSSGLTVLVRAAKTTAGAADNSEQFSSFPGSTQVVGGIGDKAYYTTDFHQLIVLKNSNWYTVTYYVDSITNSNLDTDKQLATKLQFK